MLLQDLKKVLRPAFGCAQHLQAGQNTQNTPLGLFINYVAQFWRFFDWLYCSKLLPFQFLPSWIGDLAVVGTPSTWQPRKEVHRESVVRPGCLAQHSGCAVFLRAKKVKKNLRCASINYFFLFNCHLGIIHKPCSIITVKYNSKHNF